MKITTKQLAITALMLALCIISQLFKNFSVYITGPVINLILMITTLACGPVCGIFLSILTPITSFLITGSPLMAAVPGIIPCVMLGNTVLVLVLHYTYLGMGKFKALDTLRAAKESARLIPGIVLGAVLKAIVMTLSINSFVIPMFGKNLPPKMVAVAKVQFSVTQLTTALIGGILLLVVWSVIKVVVKKQEK